MGTATLRNTNVYSNQAHEARLPFEPPCDISSIAPLGTDLALVTGRAVESMSPEWLSLKAAISVTTPLLLCACILNFP